MTGGVGRAVGKLARKVILAATKPANAFANVASKAATDTASSMIGGATVGAVNNAVCLLFRSF